MILRSSLVDTAQRCMREAYYAYHYGLYTGKGGESIDIFFGHAVHRAIEIALLDSEEDAIVYLDSLLWPPSRKKTKNAAFVLLRQFLRKFDYNIIETELLFEHPLSDAHTWRGKYDLVARKPDGLYIIENKTTNPQYLKAKPNVQFASYFKAAQETYEDFKGFIVFNLDPGELEVTYQNVHFNAEELAEWKREIICFADYMERCFLEGAAPRTGTACIRFQFRRCSFFDVCTAVGRVRDKIITNCFNVNEEAKNLSW